MKYIVTAKNPVSGKTEQYVSGNCTEHQLKESLELFTLSGYTDITTKPVPDEHAAER